MRDMPFLSARHRRVRAVLSAAVLLATLAACSVAVDGTAGRAGAATTTAGTANDGSVITQPSSTAESGGPTATRTAPVPAGLEAFYSQQLSWGPCESYSTDDSTKDLYAKPTFQCAYLTVPLDYSKPTGPTIKVGVLKVATTGSDRIGSVVMNPGGPGASGMAAAAQTADSAKALLQRFDLVGFDPRGVGASVPAIRCHTDAEMDADRALVVRTRTAAEIGAADARTEVLTKRCIEMTTVDGVDGATFLGRIGTVDVAKDLDVLRAALGDSALTYVGFSYGTSIGSQYAEQFGPNVRAMLLDGAVDPDADPVQDLLGQADGFQTAFDDFAAWCAKQAGCVLGTDPAKATAVYQALVRPLLDKPLALADGRVLSFDDATTGTIMSLYSEDFWPYLLQGLLQLSQGQGGQLMALADAYYYRDHAGHYANIIDVLATVNCMDNARMDEATKLRLAQQYAAAAPFLDNGDPPAALKSVCDFWPAEPTMTAHVPQVDGLAPVLVVSTTHDPATPYQSGVNLAKDLGGSLLTVQGTSHTAFLGANTCVDDIGNAYLIDLKRPAEGTTCS
jgi:pimeloyl-ACP methyl ester carboxylesterase